MRGSRCGGRDQSQKQQDQSNSSPSFSPSPPSLSPPSSPSLTDGWTLYDPLVEFERMGIFLMNNYTDPFRLTKVNTEYQKSPTYPRYLCVPATVEDATLDQVFEEGKEERRREREREEEGKGANLLILWCLLSNFLWLCCVIFFFFV